MAHTNNESEKLSPEGLVLLALFAILPVVFASGFTAYEVLKGAVLVAGGAILLIMFAVRALRKERVGLGAVLVFAPLLTLVAVAALSALWAANPWRAGVSAAHWLALAGLMTTALNPAVRKPKFETMALAIGAGAAVSALLGTLGAFDMDIDPRAPGRALDGLRATFDHERYAAITLAATAPLLAAGIGHGKGIVRVVLAVALACVAVFLGIANVVDAYLVLGLGVLTSLGFVVLTRGLPKGTDAKIMALAVLALAVVIAAAAMLRPPRAGDGLEPAFESFDQKVATRAADWGRPDPPTSADARAFARTSAMRVFESAPLFGVGADNLDGVVMGFSDWSSPYYKSRVDDYPAFRSAHNGYVELLAELGVVGLALLLACLLLGLVVIARTLKRGSPDDGLGDVEALGLMGVLAALAVSFALERTLTLSVSSALFFLAFGLLLARSSGGEVTGLGRPWRLGKPGKSGVGTFERVVVAGALPLVAGLGAMALAGIATASDYYKAKGDVFVRAGDLDRAREAYETATAIDPGDDLAQLNLAHILEVRGDKGHAQRELFAALAQRPNDVRIFASLGQVQMNLSLAAGRKKMQERLKAAKTGKPSETSPTELLENIDKDQMARAEYNAKRAIELHPRFLKAYLDLSNLYMTQKKLDPSLTTLLKGLKQAQGHPKRAAEFETRIGRGYLVDDKWDLAKKHLQKALDLDPSHPRVKGVLRDLERAEAHGTPSKGTAEPHGH